MSKRKSSGSNNSRRKNAAAKRRNIARRTSASGKAASATVGKRAAQAELQLVDASPIETKPSIKPSKDTMRVSLKASDLEQPAPEKISKNTMRVSLKASDLEQAAPASDPSPEKAKPSKNTMRVSLKASDIEQAAPASDPAPEKAKPSKNTMRVSLKASDLAAAKADQTPEANQPVVKRPVVNNTGTNIAKKVAKIEMDGNSPSSGDTPASTKPKGKGKRRRGSKKKAAKKQSFTSVSKVDPEEAQAAAEAAAPVSMGNGIPKETMRVNLKAPSSLTMKIDLKATATHAAATEKVNKETHSVRASSNPFVKNTREAGDGHPAVAEAAPQNQFQQQQVGQQLEQTSPQPVLQQIGGQKPKSAMSDVLSIGLFAGGFLALILCIYYFFLR